MKPSSMGAHGVLHGVGKGRAKEGERWVGLGGREKGGWRKVRARDLKGSNRILLYYLAFFQLYCLKALHAKIALSLQANLLS